MHSEDIFGSLIIVFGGALLAIYIFFGSIAVVFAGIDKLVSLLKKDIQDHLSAAFIVVVMAWLLHLYGLGLAVIAYFVGDGTGIPRRGGFYNSDVGFFIGCLLSAAIIYFEFTLYHLGR